MHVRVLLSALALCNAVALHAAPAGAAPPIGVLEGMVLNVTDGDHLLVSNNGTEIEVRLYGINAPVAAKINKNKPSLSRHGQPYADRAFMALANKVLHREVKLEIMHIDCHERAVAVVRVDGRNINHEMVAEGWAWACPKGRNQDIDQYKRAEALARARRAGLWAQDNPLPPWEFKRMAKGDERRISKAW